MPEHTLSIRLPAGFDKLVQHHVANPCQGEYVVTDHLRRAYVVSILAAVVDGLKHPTIADALIRLNGGFLIRENEPIM